MTHLRSISRLFALVAFIFAVSSAANAQATRTWVSGVGDDANPCSRTAPCKTFAGAISKTFTHGEIDALDPGGYGAVTITKSITIDGGSGFASILASGTTGVNVNIAAGNVNDPNRRVTLRRLSINGTGASGAVGTSTGIRGINWIQGSFLYVENSYIQHFVNEGINVSHTASGGFLSVKDTNIAHCGTGINLTTSALGFVVGVADRVRLEKNTNGLVVGAHGHFSIKDSFVAFNGTDGITMGGAVTDGTINVESCMVIHNGTGIRNGANGSFIRLSNTAVMENNTGLATAGGTIQSHGNNAISGNTNPGTAPSVIGPQ
jgi:hypothetical protein